MSALAWCTALCLAMATPLCAQQQHCPAAGTGELPLKYAGASTIPAITACDLMTRLYAFADDSMRGRQFGTDDDTRATLYLESELKRLKLLPAGDRGSYFQRIPLFTRALDSSSTLTVAGTVYHAGVDFVVSAAGQVADIGDLPVLFAGTANDTTELLAAGVAKGKLLFLKPGPPPPANAAQSNGFRSYQQSLAGAMMVSIAGERIPDAARAAAFAPSGPAALRLATSPAANSPSPLTGLTVTRALAEAMLGGPIASAVKGAAGRTVTPKIRFIDTPQSVGRNVVALLPGSDARFNDEFVVVGTHHDHIGVAARAVDHDSIKAFNALARPQGGNGAPRALSPAEWSVVRAAIDSLRRLHGGARPDSINNGADNSGSGSVSLLEIAEALAKGKIKLKRSIVFIWHGGQERGMWGAQYFAENPTMTRDSIVAEINIDMIGRGNGADVQVLGERRLSTELGNLVDQVNSGTGYGFRLDSTRDASGHPENAYCRNEAGMYGAWGIPVVAFTTGNHADYHMVTDEPQYIQYNAMERLDRMIMDLAIRVANLDHRVVVDHPRPSGSYAGCKQ